MFAAVVQSKTHWYESLAFNWFDLALVALLIFGYWRGRKRGMSRECLPVLFWLSSLCACAALYQIVAEQLMTGSWVRSVFGKPFTDRTAVNIGSYLLIMFGVYLVFAILNRAFKAKLEGSNAFGGSEYYLGMLAGVVRYACILLVGLALLNAPFYSAAEIAASKLYKLNTYAAGGGAKGLENDTGDFIPDLSEIQESVFKGSFFGPFIKENMGYVLINTVAPGKKARVASAH
jgi:uncharacterized membrane protein required for colicin V production